MGAKDLLRQAHQQGSAVIQPTVQVNKAETKPAVEPIQSQTIEVESSKLPSKAIQVKHPDASEEAYGIMPIATNFQLYNYDLNDFLSNFSKQNRKNGGNPITKSQLIETVLSFAYYNMKINPKGYKSAQDLIEDMAGKLKNS